MSRFLVSNLINGRSLEPARGELRGQSEVDLTRKSLQKQDLTNCFHPI